MSDFLARVDGDASRPQRPSPRLTNERPAASAISSGSCQLPPSFPQSEPSFLTLGVPHPALVRAPMASNFSTASSPSSSSSSPAASGVDPTQPWVALMKTSRQEENKETGDQVTTKKQEERGQGGSDGQKRPNRTRKYRKATHTIRKEEKEKLLTEVEVLKAQIANLSNHLRVPVKESEEDLKTEYDAGRVLRESVQKRQHVFGQISSIMSEYTLCTIQSGSPLQDFIHLKMDEQSRHETLAAIKRIKMEKAQRFMRMRRPNLDPCNLMGEERRYEAENGDFCSTRFTVTQFEDAQSVKQVFDLLLFYFCNIEISISEKLGHITIREDDGGDDEGIVQNRLVSITHKDVKMESNTVMFSQFYDRSTDSGGESTYGLIVADFVDEDDRHPYVPSQRVRRDVNAVLEIREFVPQHPKCIAGGPASRKPVVVLSRWVQNRMHYPSFPVCTDGWHELRDNMDFSAFDKLKCASMDATRFVSREGQSNKNGVSIILTHMASSRDGTFPHGGTASSTTSSTTSSPLSESARSWISVIAPPLESVDGTRQCNEGLAMDENLPDVPTHDTKAPARPKRKYAKRKHRKGTHTIRKEEKERLLEEMEVLKKELVALKKRAIDPTFPVDRLVRKSRRQVLQEGVQGHMQTFCKALSIMSDYTLCNIQAGTPLQETIVLKRDSESRRETLQAMKARKLQSAEQYLKIRRSNLDPCMSLTEDQRYETDSGGFCSARFSILQFEGAQSAKQVFDLVIFYFSNMEISVSEKLETLVTIRENDDDSITDGITQNCLVSTTTNLGMQMESNTIMFADFRERDDIPCADRGYGIVVSEFVDVDERYPYQSDKRVRKNVNGVIEVRAYNRPKKSSHDEEEEQEMVVVMTRWVQNTLHRPEFPMAVEGWRELRYSMDSWGLLLHRTLLESLQPTQ